MSIVNLATQTCSCYANSLGIQCVCTIVANMVAPQYLNPCSVNIEVAETELKEPNESLDHKVRQKLQAVNLVVNSLQFKEVSEQRKRSILQSWTLFIQAALEQFFIKRLPKGNNNLFFLTGRPKQLKRTTRIQWPKEVVKVTTVIRRKMKVLKWVQEIRVLPETHFNRIMNNVEFHFTTSLGLFMSKHQSATLNSCSPKHSECLCISDVCTYLSGSKDSTIWQKASNTSPCIALFNSVLLTSVQ